MKNYKIKLMKRIIQSVILIMGLIGYAQEDILFTFANSEIITDGSNSYYEVDVIIQTQNTVTGSFKLGSGQLYFNYNTAAFGINVAANSRFEVTHDDSYIAGQNIDAAAADIYADLALNDNETNRVSWPFNQSFSSSTFMDDNVTPTPKKLCHLKFEFIDNTKPPMLEFEDGTQFDDQFYTACGGTGGTAPFIFADCGAFPGIQLLNDFFDNSGTTLSDDQIIRTVELSIFPNPTKGLVYVEINKKSNYLVFDMQGRQIIDGRFMKGKNELQLKNYEGGVYFLKVIGDSTFYTKRIVLE